MINNNAFLLFLSDEEDSVRRTKHAHNEHNEEGKADVANGSEADDISSRYILFIYTD